MDEDNLVVQKEDNQNTLSSPSAEETEKSKSLGGDSQDGENAPNVEEAEELIKDYNFEEANQRNKDEVAQSIQSDHDSSVKATENAEKFIFSDAKKQIIMDRLHRASDYVEVGDLEAALWEFNKILFYDKSIAEAYAERGEIYLKLWDFSSAIANFKKAIQLKNREEYARNKAVVK